MVSRRGVRACIQTALLPTVADFANTLSGRPVVLCSQGPSLDPELARDLQARGAVVIASTQALDKLNAGGCAPDFAVSADPQPAHVPMAAGKEYGRLVVDTMSDPQIVKDGGDKVVHFHLRSSHIQHILWERLGLPIIWDTPALLTVGEIVIWLAYLWGSRRMVSMGIDSAYPEPHRRCLWPCQGVDGSKVYTYSHYRQSAQFTDWWVGQRPDLAFGRITCGIGVPNADNVTHAGAADWLFQPMETPEPLALSIGDKRQVAREVLTEAIDHLDPNMGAHGMANIRKNFPAIYDEFKPLEVDEGREYIETVLKGLDNADLRPEV